MTHATLTSDNCHDTLAPVTGRSGRGTARQTVRVDADLWDGFGTATELAGTDRSEAIRSFIRWYLRKPGAKMPRRPETDAGQS